MSRRTDEDKAWIEANVVEWDEYLQGYGSDGKLLVCICGALAKNVDLGTHDCPYNEQPEDWDGAP